MFTTIITRIADSGRYDLDPIKTDPSPDAILPKFLILNEHNFGEKR